MVIASSPTPQTLPLKVRWEKLPEDYKLPNDPVDNITQPALAAALTDSLSQAGRIADTALTLTNYGVCATVNDRIVVKAPDWAYVPQTTVARAEIERSYTPRLEGDIPAIVMEFVSETEGGEYSSKPTHPPGKWFFYESVLQIPYYAIFEPVSGDLELYRLNDAGRYTAQVREENGLYWVESMQLFLGTWQGEREQRQGYWLRWWDAQGQLLLWGIERANQEAQRAEQEAQRAEQEAQRAEQEAQRAERLRAQLRAAGIEPTD
ncbi:MAG: Uma2 family endonuclease [Leptolyngbya sp. RL_3_1]|nr:Uma2 family endonuclease [Leptolyngbya sp. RL_3_1]